MRKKITESNIFPSFSLEREYEKLTKLFTDKSAFGKIIYHNTKSRPSMSYDNCLESMFRNWSLRGTFTTVIEMEFGLQISIDDFAKDMSDSRLLDYIQFLLNAIVFVEEEVRLGKWDVYKADESIGKAIYDNCRLIVNKLGAEILGDQNEIYIVYTDDIAKVIGADNEDLNGSIMEYLKIDNSGNLERKGEILCTLAKKLDPYEKQLCASEFKQLCMDTTFLFNRTGVRHSLNLKDKLESKFANMENDELEKWYDKAFHSFVACMACLSYLDYKKDIKNIKDIKDI